jgi:hypothetical protein
MDAWREHCDHELNARYDDVWERYGPSFMEDMEAERRYWLLQDMLGQSEAHHEELWWENMLSRAGNVTE